MVNILELGRVLGPDLGHHLVDVECWEAILEGNVARTWAHGVRREGVGLLLGELGEAVLQVGHGVAGSLRCGIGQCVCVSIETFCGEKGSGDKEREREAKDKRDDEKENGFALQR